MMDRAAWNRQALHDLVAREFSGVRLISVSNREPYIHQRCEGGIECIQPASGLTVALDPIMRATNGVWVAHGSGNADRMTVDAFDRVAVPPEAPSYTLRRVWLNKEIEDRYYYGMANEGLWPLCHIVFQRPEFRRSDWEAYRHANRQFADAVLEEAAGGHAVVFIQDYHFALLPRMLKERNPNLTIAHFWHIPWPNRETFRAFPWREELLDGLLGSDLLGFHLQYHCANFLDTIDRNLEAMVDTERGEVRRGGRTTLIRPFPISIDFEQHAEEAAGTEVHSHMEWWRRELGGWPAYLGVGIDRADYTKGIPERLRAIDRLLETCPEYIGKLVFVQIAVPTRTHIPAYARVVEELRRLASEINDRWAMGAWRPIRLYTRHVPQPELMALHRMAEFCLVTSLHDGMNLVAKEYVGSRADEDGVLVLSRFTGAARELDSALLVNPFAVEEIADAVRLALTMPPAERTRRMRALRRSVRENNVYTWAANIMSSLAQVEDRAASPETLAAGAFVLSAWSAPDGVEHAAAGSN